MMEQIRSDWDGTDNHQPRLVTPPPWPNLLNEACVVSDGFFPGNLTANAPEEKAEIPKRKGICTSSSIIF